MTPSIEELTPMRRAVPATVIVLLWGVLAVPQAVGLAEPPEASPAVAQQATEDAGFRHAGGPPATESRGERSAAPAAPSTWRTLAVEVVDRNGDAPTGEHAPYALALGIDDGGSYAAWLADGSGSVELPPGRYSMAAFVATPEPDGTVSRTLAIDPLVVVPPADGEPVPTPVALTLDARTATQPVTVAVAGRPEAEVTQGTVLFSQPGGAGSGSHPWFAYDMGPGGRSYVTPTERIAGSHLFVWAGLTEGGEADSPYSYHLVSDAADRVPRRPAFRHRNVSLAEVRTTFASHGEPECARLTVGTTLHGEAIGFSSPATTVATPGRHTAYLTPGPQEWRLAAQYAGPGCDASAGGDDDYYIRYQAFPTAGRHTAAWGGAPVSAALGVDIAAQHADWVPYHAAGRREGDRIVVALPALADAGVGHTGSAGLPYPWSGVTGWTTLATGGRKVGGSDEAGTGAFDVGPDPATYTLETEIERARTWSELSPRQHFAWTFRSAHDPDGVPDALPLHVVRVDARLDRRGRAPVGPFGLTLRTESVPGAAVGTVEDVTLDVSYDDGATWQPAPLTPLSTPGGPRWVATVDHPAAASWVSLRMHAADTDGNTVDQAIERAYAIGARR